MSGGGGGAFFGSTPGAPGAGAANGGYGGGGGGGAYQGGGGYSGGGGGEGLGYGGGGGGSFIDTIDFSGTVVTEVSGIASPDDLLNGEIIICDVSAVPEPATYGALAGAGVLLTSLCGQFRRKRQV
jgi:hypothetical protein